MTTTQSDAVEPLPDYMPMLAAYHRAFAKTLRRMIESLPFPPAARVLDMATGDGAYLPWLAERAGEGGTVVALDLARPCLKVARDMVPPAAAPVVFCQADAGRLPLPSESLDLVWCAQSLYSLPEPLPVLAEMARVARRGGSVAVLENDSLHHLILPWPIELELALRRAEWQAIQGQSGDPERFYVGRALARLMRQAGLRDPVQESWATTRQAPLSDDDRLFFQAELDALRRRVADHLPPDTLVELDRLVDPASPAHMLDQADFVVTTIDLVVRAVKP